jgi:hypothetical protein
MGQVFGLNVNSERQIMPLCRHQRGDRARRSALPPRGYAKTGADHPHPPFNRKGDKILFI